VVRNGMSFTFYTNQSGNNCHTPGSNYYNDRYPVYMVWFVVVMVFQLSQWRGTLNNSYVLQLRYVTFILSTSSIRSNCLSSL